MARCILSIGKCLLHQKKTSGEAELCEINRKGEGREILTASSPNEKDK